MNGQPFSPDAQDTDPDGLIAAHLKEIWERPTTECSTKFSSRPTPARGGGRTPTDEKDDNNV